MFVYVWEKLMPKNIVEGVDNIIDESLNITQIGKAPHYDHIKSCLLLKNHPSSFDAYEVICQIYNQVEQNFNHPENRFHLSGPSEQNWRFEKIPYIDENNLSEEKKLEKATAKPAFKDWANQVPTAGGIINSTSDKLRNIDLAHELKIGFYEFIELKIESNTPLFAAFEIIVNGLIYLVSRKNYQDQHLDGKKLLAAKEIILQTLAPRDYYARYKLDWLEKELNRGLSKFLLENFKGKLKMRFAFTSFPDSFNWPCEDAELLNALDNRSVVTWVR